MTDEYGVRAIAGVAGHVSVSLKIVRGANAECVAMRIFKGKNDRANPY